MSKSLKKIDTRNIKYPSAEYDRLADDVINSKVQCFYELPEFYNKYICCELHESPFFKKLNLPQHYFIIEVSQLKYLKIDGERFSKIYNEGQEVIHDFRGAIPDINSQPDWLLKEILCQHPFEEYKYPIFNTHSIAVTQKKVNLYNKTNFKHTIFLHSKNALTYQEGINIHSSFLPLYSQFTVSLNNISFYNEDGFWSMAAVIGKEREKYISNLQNEIETDWATKGFANLLECLLVLLKEDLSNRKSFKDISPESQELIEKYLNNFNDEAYVPINSKAIFDGRKRKDSSDLMELLFTLAKNTTSEKSQYGNANIDRLLRLGKIFFSQNSKKFTKKDIEDFLSAALLDLPAIEQLALFMPRELFLGRPPLNP